jgi:hypothetical protein
MLRRLAFAAATPGALALGLRRSTWPYSFAEKEKKEGGEGDEWRYMGVYLTEESHKNLQAQLDQIGIGKTHDVGKRVIVRSTLTSRDEFVYFPIYGERVAFRLKGILRAEDSGLVVGTGRLSTVAGELKDDDCEASVTLYPKKREPQKSFDERAAMDLATRLSRADVVRGKPFWKGRILPQTILDRGYSAERATFTALNWADQIVVDGYLCGSNHVDENGACTFDRSTLSEKDVLPPSESSTMEAKKSGSAGKSASASEGADDGDKAECPVCKFMKGGPCKEQFLVWDACVQGMKEDEDLSTCFPVTVKMMECMRNFEYYDIMTVNSGKYSTIEGEKDDK